MVIKNFIHFVKLDCVIDIRRQIMSNFEIKDNKMIISGLTEEGKLVTIELDIEELLQVRNEYIKNNKEYVKKAMLEAFKLLFG